MIDKKELKDAIASRIDEDFEIGFVQDISEILARAKEAEAAALNLSHFTKELIDDVVDLHSYWQHRKKVDFNPNELDRSFERIITYISKFAGIEPQL